MDVILKEDIKSIGRAGDKVSVKSGYARNYLIPKGLALEVSAANMKFIDLQKKKRIKEEQLAKEKAEQTAQKLSSVSCTIAINAGEEDKIFGSVTHADVAVALKAEGVVVDKRDIIFEEEISKLGIYTCKVKLHPQVIQQVKLWIVKK